MKKYILFISALMISFGILTSCSADSADNTFTENQLREQYPEYFDLNAFKGIEVYVWQMAENSYRCGALSGTNRIKSPEEIHELQFNSASIEEMKAILSFYDIPKEYVIIIPCQQPYSSYNYEIDDSYCTKIEELFDE